MEHDVRCPDSHPLALEFLLGMLVQMDVPAGSLLDSTAGWLENHRQPDGSLTNPPALLDYPHAPWWNGGGQTAPDSIVGNLERLDCLTDSLRRSTEKWVEKNLSPEKIRANDWLFMAYHAYDYFVRLRNLADYEAHWQATVDNIIACTERARPEQYYELFRFAPTSDSPVAKALPTKLFMESLDYLGAAQHDDGSWHDEHGLSQWYPYTTIIALNGLRNHGRDIGRL